MSTNSADAQLKATSLLELQFISDPKISPTGNQAVAVHTHIHQKSDTNNDSDAGEAGGAAAGAGGAAGGVAIGKDSDAPQYHSHIHLYNLDTGSAGSGGVGQVIQLTQAGTRNSSPEFNSKSTHIAFLSNRPGVDSDSAKGGEVSQLNLLALGGGEAVILTSFKRGVSNFVWHPDGTKIAVLTYGDEEEPDAGQPKVIDKFTYKWDQAGFLPTVKPKLYIVDIDTARGSDAQYVCEFDFAPSGLQFNTSGDAIIYAASPNIEAEDKWLSNIFQIDIANIGSDGFTGEPKRLLSKDLRIGYFTIDSADETIYLLTGADPDNFSSPTALWKAPVSTGVVERITDTETDLSPLVGGDSKYGKYSTAPKLVTTAGTVKHIVLCANRNGHAGLVNVDVVTGEISDIHDQQERISVSGFDTNPVTGRSVATIETPTTPGELYLVESDGSQAQLSSLNSAFVEQYDLITPSETRKVRAPGSDTDVDYWVISPTKARKDNAVVVQVHGGPHTNYGFGFIFEFQLLAAAGYTVVYGNPRGSSSYGHDFATAMLGGYGTVDADDVMAVTEAAMASHIDTSAPVHLTGGSYGGFMTNWLTGQTDRFRSAVTQRSISNWLSMFGTSDIGPTFTEHQIGSTPWGDLELLWKQSPLANVSNVKTPTLIIHSEADYRCPVEQAEQWFVALKCHGVDTKLVRYPDECHELSRSGRPDRRIHRLESILDWFQTHP